MSLEPLLTRLIESRRAVDPALVQQALEDHLRAAACLSDDEEQREARRSVDLRYRRAWGLVVDERTERLTRVARNVALAIAALVFVVLHVAT